MADIRNFFSPKGASKRTVANPEESSSKSRPRNRPKPLLSDSDDDDFVKATPDVSSKAKRKPKSRGKPKVIHSDDSGSNSPVKKQMKVVDPKDFFAASKTETKTKTKRSPTENKAVNNERQEKKRKNPDVEFHDDPDFAAMLLDMNDDNFTPSPMKKQKTEANQKKDSKMDCKKQSPSNPTKRTSPRKADVKVEKPLKSPVKSPPKQESSSKPKTAFKAAEETVKMPKKDLKTDLKPDSPKKQPLKIQGPIETGQSQLWVDKYKPTSAKSIIGQQGDKSNMKKLISWLQNWTKNHRSGAKPPPRPPPWGASQDNGGWAKAALLSGPPGVGKTTTAYLVSKELGYEVTELNASDTRSKKQLDSVVSDLLSTRWVNNTAAKKVLLMDEVDGMAGNEDRGGVGELIQLMKQSKVPIICMCNDRNHQKIRNLANYCFDLRFSKPRVEQIKSAMMSVCFKEKIKIAPEALTDLIVGCNQDVRQVLHQLSMLKARNSDEKLTSNDIKSETERSQKTSIKMGPWDVCRKVFSATDHSSMSLMDKSDLFFHDYSLGPLFVQENYLSVTPKAGEKDRKKHMLLLSKASDSLCDGDLVERTIRSRNSWNLLPVQAMMSSVLPGEYMSGYLKGQIQFPNWLGRYSKQNKFDRMLQEVQIHTRLSANLSKQALNRDFLQQLRDGVVKPLATKGGDGVNDAVEVMNHYALLREDLDNLLELTQWPDQPDVMKAVESKVKAAFTRAYNKHVFLPYSTNVGTAAKKASKANAVDMDIVEDEDEDEDDNEDIGKDSMIKAKKKAAPKTNAKTESGKGKGRGKGKKK